MNDDLNTLSLGYIPDKFDFSIKKKDEIDFNKIQYNALYKSPLYYLNKLPNPQAFLNLPFGSGITILNEIANKSLSPLEEYNLRLAESLIFVSEIEPQSGVILNQ